MNVTVFAAREQDRAEAAALASRLGVDVAQDERRASAPLVLRLDENGLSLAGDGMVLHGDFAAMLPRLRQGKLQQELLVKAAKLKNRPENPTAVDATAGLGEDAILLAAAGFDVTLFESNPVIAALLDDALRRARMHPDLSEIVARMHLVEGDSVEGLRRIEPGQTPDVVYLDPMFPARSKSAAVKKKFQLLHHLEQPCSNQEEMLEAALSVHPRKVVIKRPPKGPYLADEKPSYSLTSKAVRYDCIVPPPATMPK